MFISERGNGKSTMINALLCAEVLRTDVTECTAVATVLVYSPRPYLRAYGKATATHLPITEESNLSETELRDCIARWTTHDQDPFANDLNLVVIGWPSQMLRSRLCLIDTPALDADKVRDCGGAAVIDKLIPLCDLIVFLVNIDKSVSKFNFDYLKKRRQLLLSKRIIFAVNKIDQVIDSKTLSACDAFKGHLNELLYDADILPVSALAGVMSLRGNRPERGSHISVPPTLRVLEKDDADICSGDYGYREELHRFSNLDLLRKRIMENIN
jgi:hypothetical protein